MKDFDPGTATVASVKGVRMDALAPRGPCVRPDAEGDDATGDVFAVVPVRTVNVTNAREHHMAKHRRTKREYDAVYAALIQHHAKKSRYRDGCRITLTRIAPCPVGATNLHATLKGIIDGVAQWLLGGTPGQYDDDGRIEWNLEQCKAGRGVYGVTISIRATGTA